MKSKGAYFLASCANSLDWGGVKKVCEISGYSKDIVIRGKQELATNTALALRMRKKGGGHKKMEESNPEILNWIEQIVSSSMYGNPETPLVRTTQSLRKIQDSILSEHQIYIYQQRQQLDC